MSRDKIKPFIEGVLKALLAMALIYYLYQSGYFSWQKIGLLLDYKPMTVGVLLIGIVLFLATERFRYLVNPNKLKRLAAWKLNLVGVFFSYFIPGGVGGDLVKGVLLYKGSELSRSASAYVIFLDRILGLFTMSLLSLAAFLFVPDRLRESNKIMILFLFLLLVFFGVTIAFFILISSKFRTLSLLKVGQLLGSKIHEKINYFHDRQVAMELPNIRIIKAFMLSLLTQIVSIGLFVYVGSITHPDLDIPFAIYYFVVPIGFILTAVPISPGGIGVGQAAFLFLFSRALGKQSDLGVLSITAFQFYQLIWGLLGAYYFITIKKQERAQIKS